MMRAIGAFSFSYTSMRVELSVHTEASLDAVTAVNSI
jgi:hypothetical protein